MKKMMIFEPAMCCSTGVCGPSVDENLLRVSTIINRLTKNGMDVERHNLSGNPGIFVENKTVNSYLMKEGVDILPITIIDGEVVKTREYPSNQEFAKFLGLSEKDIEELGTKKENKLSGLL